MGKIINSKVLGLLTPRERLWAEIRKRPEEFTAERVAHAARMKLSSARDYLQGLVSAGFIDVARESPKRSSSIFKPGGKPMPTYHYRLVRDVGAEAPRVTRDGTLVRKGEAEEALWITLRITGVTDFRTLAAQACTPECAVSEETARYYIRNLMAAGYLDQVTVGVRGHHGTPAQYRLKPTMNTGPKAPQVQNTKRVWDPNLALVMFQERPELDEERRDGVSPADDRTDACIALSGCPEVIYAALA